MSCMATTTVQLERSGPAVRAALAEVAPDECAQFEVEFRQALSASHRDFDADRMQAVIGRWWARALALLDPDPAADAAWDRIKAGDTSDLVEEWRPQHDGSQHVYRRTTGGGEWAFSHVVGAAGS